MGATAGAVSEGGEARQATGDSAHQGAHHAATLIQPVPSVVVMDGPGVGVKKESSMPEVEEFDSKEAAKGLEREEGLGEEDGCKEDEDERKDGSGDFWAEDELARLALAFFTATTKCSNDNEDILPQEDSDEMKLSVFHIFASLFPRLSANMARAPKISVCVCTSTRSATKSTTRSRVEECQLCERNQGILATASAALVGGTRQL